MKPCYKKIIARLFLFVHRFEIELIGCCFIENKNTTIYNFNDNLFNFNYL